LLKAGVVRRIRSQAPAPAAHRAPAPTIVFHDEWAGDPGAALARRIWVEAGADGTALALDVAVARWGEARGGLLLLILDQFEEYLRLHPDSTADAAAADSFARDFPALVARTDLRVHVLVSLRDDALADLDRFEGRIPSLFDNYLRLPPMTVAAAREAIVRPIACVNEWRLAARLPAVGIDDDLIDEVLVQLTDPARWSHETGAPRAGRGDAVEPAFLQLVMKRLWEIDAARSPRRLRLSTLAELHGADAIVRDHLESAMASLPRDQQDVAAAMFAYLVTPSGAKIRYTPEDLAAYAKRPVPAIREVLDALARPARRIVRRVPAPSGEADRHGYEIFHDVLGPAVRAWGQRRQTARLQRRTVRLGAALATTVAIAAALLAYARDFTPLQRLELRTLDARFTVRGGHPPDPKIVLVGLDDRTVRELPGSGRVEDAQVLRDVLAGDPAAIVEDFEFKRLRPGTTPLLAEVQRARTRLVLATFRIDNDGNTTLFGATTPARAFGGATAGYSGFPRDVDQAVRRVRAEGRQQPPAGSNQPTAGLATVAVAAAEKAGAHVAPGSFPAPGALIDFAGRPGTYRPISYVDVLRGAIAPRPFAVGSSSSVPPMPTRPTASGRRPAGVRCPDPRFTPTRSPPSGPACPSATPAGRSTPRRSSSSRSWPPASPCVCRSPGASSARLSPRSS
jgi:hypothetical protein